MTDKPTKIEFEEMYDDDSGVNFAVRADFSTDTIELENIDKFEFPMDRLAWFIDRLTQIRDMK